MDYIIIFDSTTDQYIINQLREYLSKYFDNSKITINKSDNFIIRIEKEINDVIFYTYDIVNYNDVIIVKDGKIYSNSLEYLNKKENKCKFLEHLN
jgi:hypothetical protein